MTNQPQNRLVRRVARVLAITPAIIVTSLTGTAFAEAPEQWESDEGVSSLYALLVLGAVPLGLLVLITLLVYLPSMSKGQSYRPGEVWRGEPTWFGGPRGGVDKVGETAPPAQVAAGSETARGGTSGGW